MRVSSPWRRWVARHVTAVTAPAGMMAPPGNVSSVWYDWNVATIDDPSKAASTRSTGSSVAFAHSSSSTVSAWLNPARSALRKAAASSGVIERTVMLTVPTVEVPTTAGRGHIRLTLRRLPSLHLL